MKTLLLILLLSIPTFAQVTANYDKFKDQTTLSTDSVHIDRIFLAVRGIKKADETFYYLVFHSASSSWKFLSSHGLIFLADGERINLGDGTHRGDVSSRLHSVGVTERMIYIIEKSDLEKLAKASSVEMKLGYLEAKLDEKDRKGMREILEYK